jgi:hypothetical protein
MIGAPASVWWRRFWATPWAGNYRFNPEGTVGFLDLGSPHFSREAVPAVGRVVRAAVEDRTKDYPELVVAVAD